MNIRKYFFLLLLVLLTITLGFLRDYIFVSINHIIESGSDADGNFTILKWALTFLFSLLYFAITCGFLFVLFKSKRYFWIALFVYAALFTVSFVAGAAGLLISSFSSIGGSSSGWQNVYPFIRTVLGIAQSPVVMMILIPACYLNEAKKK